MPKPTAFLRRHLRCVIFVATSTGATVSVVGPRSAIDSATLAVAAGFLRPCARAGGHCSDRRKLCWLPWPITASKRPDSMGAYYQSDSIRTAVILRLLLCHSERQDPFAGTKEDNGGLCIGTSPALLKLTCERQEPCNSHLANCLTGPRALEASLRVGLTRFSVYFICLGTSQVGPFVHGYTARGGPVRKVSRPRY